MMRRRRKNANVVNRMTMEAASKIRTSVEIQGANRERAEYGARVKAEAEIWENSDKTMKAREAKAKAGAETG